MQTLKRHNQGFTLLEVGLAVLVFALVAAFSIPNFREETQGRQATVITTELMAIAEAAKAFAVMNQGVWPDFDASENPSCLDALDILENTAAIPDAPVFLSALNRTTPFGTSYETSCTQEGTLFSISIETTEEIAQIVANNLPLTEANGNVSTTNVVLPGSVGGMDQLLSRQFDAGRPELNQMQTNLNFIAGTGMQSQESNQFAGILLDQNGQRNSQKADPAGSIDLNDVRLRALDNGSDFLSQLFGQRFVFVGSQRVIACESPRGRNLIDAFDNCGDRVVDLRPFVGSDRPRLAIVRVELCGSNGIDRVQSLEGRGGTNTIEEVRNSSNFNFRDPHAIEFAMLPGDETGASQVIARTMMGGRKGGGSHVSIMCQASQHFVPLDEQQQLRIRMDIGRFFGAATAELFIEGYIAAE